MQEDFPDCAVPSVKGNSTFDSFLRDCCRLAWEICVLSPPLRVTTMIDERFDERLHDAYLQEAVTNARIDFYLWPALYSHRHGDILRKGRVSLCVATSAM